MPNAIKPFDPSSVGGQTLIGDAVSNLDFCPNFRVEVIFNESGLTGQIKLGSLETDIDFNEVSGNENDILIYEFKSLYEDGASYLHIRKLESEIKTTYKGQTVQHGKAPGGSTFYLEVK